MSRENRAERPVQLKEKRRRRLGPLWAVIYLVLAVLVVVLSVRLYVVTSYLVVPVDGDSMLETIHDGDVLYASRGVRSAKRGDIVVVDVTDVSHFALHLEKDDSGKCYIIKRLVAVEGDKIKCEHGVLLLDTGEGYAPVDESYLAAGTHTDDFREVVLGEGEIFVMGDNRTNSDDSRALYSATAEKLTSSMLTGVVRKWSLPESEISGGFEEWIVKAFINGIFR